jgi:hypothetical protein
MTAALTAAAVFLVNLPISILVHTASNHGSNQIVVVPSRPSVISQWDLASKRSTQTRALLNI